MIADDIALSREMHRLASGEAELEALTQSLSINTFRYIPPGLTGSRPARRNTSTTLNTALLARMQAEGTAYLSNAVIDGNFALRACIVNFRTTSADVKATIDVIVRLGRVIDAEMRPAGLRGPIRAEKALDGRTA